MLCRLATAIGNTHTKTNPEPEIRREPFVRTTRVLCETYWYKWFGEGKRRNEFVEWHVAWLAE